MTSPLCSVVASGDASKQRTEAPFLSGNQKGQAQNDRATLQNYESICKTAGHSGLLNDVTSF